MVKIDNCSDQKICIFGTPLLFSPTILGYEKQGALFVNVQPYVADGMEMADPRINVAKSQLDPNVRYFN